MKQSLIRSAIRTGFLLTGRNRASVRIRGALAQYLSLAQKVGPEAGRQSVSVPPMIGVDEDMRDWSFFMILEHNVIVNRSISAIVAGLARGEKSLDSGVVDLKRDVMPSADPGPEQIRAFQASVEAHLDSVARLPRLRSTPTHRHPIFGQLTAHGWHCMFGLHLDIHHKQAETVARLLDRVPEGDPD